MDNKLNIAQTAEILGVSNATIKNWVRHEYLFPLDKSKEMLFDSNKVSSLKWSISKGEIERLNRRANKRNSLKKFVPKEYAGKDTLNSSITSISDHIIANSLEIHQSIFLLSVNLLTNEKMVFSKDLKRLNRFEDSDYKNLFLRDVLKNFYIQINTFSKDKKYIEILDFAIPNHPDVLGLLYQSIKCEGDKAKLGSYYTPKEIVNDIISEYARERIKVLDPCCGTGQFLLSASEFITDPSNLYGFDIDPVAIFISKINLIIKYNHTDFNPNISLKDSLLEMDNSTLFSNDKSPVSYDLIVTNPPWGLHFENGTLKSLKTLFPNINSLESFSYFLLKSIDFLEENGVLSFILPESILNIKVHSDIRKIILKHTSILKIVKLGRAFTNVFTNVIRIDLKKSTPTKTHMLEIIANDNFKIQQYRFWSNPDLIFDIEVNDKDLEIIEKVFSTKHVKLKNNSDWALGIVTGDNKKFISPVKENGFEEIYKGKDVNRYALSSAQNYIKFEPSKFQQVAPVEKYRAKEKLIYKFISNKLVFAYDNQQRLTLNSANLLIPRIQNYPIKMILAFLNSSLYQFLYTKKFNTIKVLRGNLEELPFPHLTETKSRNLISLVDKVISKEIDQLVIDDFIMEVFCITQNERAHIIKNT